MHPSGIPLQDLEYQATHRGELLKRTDNLLEFQRRIEADIIINGHNHLAVRRHKSPIAAAAAEVLAQSDYTNLWKLLLEVFRSPIVRGVVDYNDFLLRIRLRQH
jgi:hypothetical protein